MTPTIATLSSVNRVALHDEKRSSITATLGSSANTRLTNTALHAAPAWVELGTDGRAGLARPPVERER